MNSRLRKIEKEKLNVGSWWI